MMNPPDETMEAERQHSPASSAKASWEVNLGIKWFSRAGIVALLIGFAMGLNYSFPYLNSILIPEVKLLIGGLVAFGLFLVGNKLQERFQLLGRILQGGGFALGYLTLFGMFFIPVVQLFTAPHLQSLGWGLLLLYVAGMLVFSQRQKSLAIAILSLGFGYYTASYSGSQSIALLSAGLLGCGATATSFGEGRKSILPVGLLGGLFTGLYWHWFNGAGTAHLNLLPTFLIGDKMDELLFLLFNYLIFQIAGFCTNVRNENDSWDLTVFNSLLLYLAILLIQGEMLLGSKGLIEAGIAAVHLVSFLMLKTFKPEAKTIARAQLLLGATFTILATMGLMNAEVKPVAFSLEALILGVLVPKSESRPLYTALTIIFLILGFISLGFFSWDITPALTLIPVAGAVALTTVLLNETAFSSEEPVYRIILYIISSLVFLMALMMSLQTYWITLAVVLTGSILLLGGFLTSKNHYRWAGLCWIFLAGVRLLTVDLLTLEMPYKILLFLVLGVALLGGSYGYNQLHRAGSGSKAKSEEHRDATVMTLETEQN